MTTTALMVRMYPDQREAFERGEGAGLFMKRISVEVRDFYKGQP